MNLTNLINYLVSPDQLKELFVNERLNTESEALLIYMKETLDIESEIKLFEIEETDDDLLYEKGGIKYVQLFPIDYAIELIKSDLDLLGKGYNDLEIANRLLEYRIKDA